MYLIPGVPPVEYYFDQVLTALRTVRLHEAGLPESDIHAALSNALRATGIEHRREYAFAPRCRADIWVQGICIEVKKQRPPRAALLAQLMRYAEQPSLRGLVVVMERSVNLPAEITGKRVAIVSLNALWGIAL